MKQVLVLGGTGFVGQHVVRRLEREGIKAVVASRRTGLDLRDYLAVRRYLDDVQPDAIINCAAHVGSVHYVTQFAADVLHDNLQMTLNLYRAVHELHLNARITNPLANCSYPGEGETYRESEWLAGPTHPSVFSYGEARRMTYFLARAYQMEYGVRSANFLVPNTYGPGDYTDPNKTHALNGMIVRLLKAKRTQTPTFEIWGTGKPVREWLYVADLAEILVRSLSMEEDLLYPVNIGQQSGTTIRELAEMIARAVGYKGELVFNTDYQDGAPVKIMANERFQRLFPHYRFYDMEEGIRETVAYYERVL